jgi:hypothetical protein
MPDDRPINSLPSAEKAPQVRPGAASSSPASHATPSGATAAIAAASV